MKSTNQTYVCRLCFKDIENATLKSFIRPDQYLCDHCFSKFNLNISKFVVESIKGYALFRYDDVIKDCLYKVKGIGDIELSPIFLSRYSFELHVKFLNYYLIPMPSWREDDEKRGFNHVIDIFRTLDLPILPILYKKENIKQANQKGAKRYLMEDNIGILSTNIVKGKRILLIDDVTTTGSTLRGAIKVVSQCKPKDIKILVLSKNG